MRQCQSRATLALCFWLTSLHSPTNQEPPPWGFFVAGSGCGPLEAATPCGTFRACARGRAVRGEVRARGEVTVRHSITQRLQHHASYWTTARLRQVQFHAPNPRQPEIATLHVTACVLLVAGLNSRNRLTSALTSDERTPETKNPATDVIAGFRVPVRASLVGPE